jgi:hypothetical protein
MSVLGLKNLTPSLSKALNHLLLAALQSEPACSSDLVPQLGQVPLPAQPSHFFFDSLTDEPSDTVDLLPFSGGAYFLIDICR